MAEQQKKLGKFQDKFLVCRNKAENDDMWNSTDPAWLGRASMSKRHRLLILKDLRWEWFNCLTFGLLNNLDMALTHLYDLKAAAKLWVKAQPDWPPWGKVGLYVHPYSLCHV